MVKKRLSLQARPGVLLLAVLALEVALLVSSYVMKSIQVAGAPGFPLDDSWIHAHFARNIAAGKGFVFNPGEPVSSTTPLYTLLLSVLFAVRVSPIMDAILLGALLHLATAWLIYRIARHISLSYSVAAASALVFASVPRLIWGAIGGMEVPLYVFLITLGIFFHIRYQWRDGVRGYYSTAVWGLATLARPECGAMILISLLDRLITIRKAGSKMGAGSFLLRVPAHLLLFGIILLPAALFNLSYSNSPLPPTFAAKTVPVVAFDTLQLLLLRVQLAAAYVWQAIHVCIIDNRVLVLGLLPGVVICALAVRRSNTFGASILPLAFLLIPIITSTVAPTDEGGAQLSFQYGRYSGYLVPLFILMSAVGWNWLLVISGRWIRYVRIALACLLVFAMWISITDNRATGLHYALQVHNINSMQVALGKWAAKLPRQTVIAANDVGAIAYFSNRRIIDTVGIINPELTEQIKGAADKELVLFNHLKAKRPDYAILFPNWYPNIAARTDVMEPVKSVTLGRNFICGADTMVVYRCDW